MRFSSNGSISGNRLQPTRYSDTRKGRAYAGATFDYGSKTITYGKAGHTESQPLAGPTFDLFTLAWQLALNNGQLPANLHITNGNALPRARHDPPAPRPLQHQRRQHCRQPLPRAARRRYHRIFLRPPISPISPPSSNTPTTAKPRAQTA